MVAGGFAVEGSDGGGEKKINTKRTPFFAVEQGFCY